MKIKNIITVSLVCCAFATAFTSCSKDNEAYYTVSEDDAPRILNTDFPDGGFSINSDANLKFEVLVTPADYTTVKWLVDGKEVFEGTTIDQAFEAGDYTLKILAVTNRGKETSRTMKLTVKALDTDPQGSNETADRLVKIGTAVKLHGANMANIQKLSINGQQIDATYNSTEECLEYTVPASMPEGVYRISAIDAQGISYGMGMITFVSHATANNSTFAGTSNGTFTINGFYLDAIATVTIDGKPCTITAKTESELTVTAPELAVGDYDLQGTTESGEALKFYKDGQLLEKGTFMVSEEEVLWMGDFNVDWDGPEDHKEWRMISQEKFATFEIGHTLNISLKLVGSDYHKAQFDNWSWEGLPIPNPVIEFGEDKVVSIEITQDLKNAVAAKAFCIHGHGFSVVKATYK